VRVDTALEILSRAVCPLAALSEVNDEGNIKGVRANAPAPGGRGDTYPLEVGVQGLQMDLFREM